MLAGKLKGIIQSCKFMISMSAECNHPFKTNMETSELYIGRPPMSPLTKQKTCGVALTGIRAKQHHYLVEVKISSNEMPK